MSRLALHSERHLVSRIGWLRAAVLGANDGLVSTASLVIGVAAADASRGPIVVAGVAGLVEPRRVLVLDGHPDADPARYGHALAAAYGQGAAAAGHVVHRVNLSDMAVPLLTARRDWEDAMPCETVRGFQDELAWAEHLVIICPLWLGSMPARLKALFEQAFRPAFAFGGKPAAAGAGRLKGRSVRIIITMGMPALVYRTLFRSHSLKAVKSGMLALVGFGPVRDTVLGGIETRRDRERVLKRISAMGARAA